MRDSRTSAIQQHSIISTSCGSHYTVNTDHMIPFHHHLQLHSKVPQNMSTTHQRRRQPPSRWRVAMPTRCHGSGYCTKSVTYRHHVLFRLFLASSSRVSSVCRGRSVDGGQRSAVPRVRAVFELCSSRVRAVFELTEAATRVRAVIGGWTERPTSGRWSPGNAYRTPSYDPASTSFAPRGGAAAPGTRR